jgi:tRNA dimethylallyltransferase
LNNWPIIIILGPTASGKSGLAVQLASQFDGEIINCDSVQVYRYLDIGTSKPSMRERAGIPHHLLDFLPPDAVFTAGDFMTTGRQLLDEIKSRGKIPFVVGGTGLYLRALLEGLFQGPKRSEELRQRFQQISQHHGVARLHRLLCRVDPVSAVKISPQDKPKIIRALEVYWLTRRPLSEQHLSGKEPLRGYHLVKLGLNPPRELLYKAINERVQCMFEEGLVEEVKKILEMGFLPTLKPLQSLGYAQVIQYLQQSLTMEETIRLTQQLTRNYSKRQLTWFRREPGVKWLEGFGNHPALIETAATLIKEQGINLHCPLG